VKIDGLNNFLINSFQVISDLNLKEGQIIVGKIISLSTDEAWLEIAGRPLQAKVEGNPPATPDSVATFRVGKDEQGRILLKFLANVSDTNNTSGTLPKGINPDGSINAAIFKTIRASLQKEGVAPSPANIETIFRNMRDFQLKYQQPISPQILSFILARKWPITPGTILTSLVFQDQEVRDVLWNALLKSLPEKELAEFITKYVLVPQADSAAITGKMIASSDLKSIQDFLEKLFKLNLSSSQTDDPTIEQLKADAKNFTGKTNSDPALQLKRHTSETVRPESRLQVNPGKDLPVLQKSDSEPAITADSKALGIAGKLGKAEPQKIAAVLEQQITFARSLPANESVSNSSHSIPWLIHDSQNGLRELPVKWREEWNESRDGHSNLLIYLAIPTENMGDINLSIRVTEGSTRIKMRVGNDEVRNYLQKHITELKEAVGPTNTVITVGLTENESLNLNNSGIDLWM
jgi:hypothetical protein